MTSPLPTRTVVHGVELTLTEQALANMQPAMRAEQESLLAQIREVEAQRDAAIALVAEKWNLRISELSTQYRASVDAHNGLAMMIVEAVHQRTDPKPRRGRKGAQP